MKKSDCTYWNVIPCKNDCTVCGKEAKVILNASILGMNRIVTPLCENHRLEWSNNRLNL